MLVFKYTAVLGAIILCTGLLTLLLLPGFIPIATLRCNSYGVCIGSSSPVYPAIYVVSMAGAVLIFWGLFDRAFILGPFFLLGLLVAAFGLAYIVLGYIGFETCLAHPVGLGCVAYNPELFEPIILLGGSLISVNAYLWCSAPSGTPRMSRRPRAKFFGVVSVVFGMILFLFGLTVVATLVGNFLADEVHWLFWIQVFAGLVLMPAGVLLIASSTEVEKSQGSY